jgi:hypothetical protein
MPLEDQKMTDPAVKRNVCFVLLGVGALVLKARYSGPFTEAIHNWGGNVSVSFAVYFVFASSILGRRCGRLVSAAMALLVVLLFEVTNGFGVMTNVYDPIDFAANLAGVGVAGATDIGASNWARRRSGRTASEAREKPIEDQGAPPNGGPAPPPGSPGVREGRHR